MFIFQIWEKIKGLSFDVKNFDENDYDYVIMTNRSRGPSEKEKNLQKIKSCFQIIDGEDITKVVRNGLILSTLRKKS